MEQNLARQVATPLDDSGGSHLNFQILNVNVELRSSLCTL